MRESPRVSTRILALVAAARVTVGAVMILAPSRFFFARIGDRNTTHADHRDP